MIAPLIGITHRNPRAANPKRASWRILSMKAVTLSRGKVTANGDRYGGDTSGFCIANRILAIQSSEANCDLSTIQPRLRATIAVMSISSRMVNLIEDMFSKSFCMQHNNPELFYATGQSHQLRCPFLAVLARQSFNKDRVSADLTVEGVVTVNRDWHGFASLNPKCPASRPRVIIPHPAFHLRGCCAAAGV